MFEFRGLPRPCANPVGLTFLGNKTSTAARLLVPFTKASGLMWIALCGRKTQIWALGKRSFITRDSCSRYVNAGVIDRHSGIFAELFTHLTSLLFQLRSSTCRVKLQTHVQNDPRSGFSEGINNYHLFFLLRSPKSTLNSRQRLWDLFQMVHQSQKGKLATNN